jgi:hypothetical protein
MTSPSPEPKRYGQIRSTGREGRIIDDLDRFFVNSDESFRNIKAIKTMLGEVPPGETVVSMIGKMNGKISAMDGKLDRILSALTPDFHLDDAEDLTVPE